MEALQEEKTTLNALQVKHPHASIAIFTNAVLFCKGLWAFAPGQGGSQGFRFLISCRGSYEWSADIPIKFPWWWEMRDKAGLSKRRCRFPWAIKDKENVAVYISHLLMDCTFESFFYILLKYSLLILADML